MTDLLIDYQKELDKRSVEYHEICKNYARMKQVFSRMEDLKKTRLAQIKSEILQEAGGRTTAAILETYGLADKRYEDYLGKVADARDMFLEAEMEREALNNRIEALRTLVSLEKAKMSHH